MLALIQRVESAHVVVAGQTIGQIGTGLLVLLCAERGDVQAQADKMLDKILKLRIFADAQGRMNHSVQDVQGALLLVSQFTLAADLASGNRPGFSRAAAPDEGRKWYDYVVARARAAMPDVACGIFGAEMKVHLVNDGPVTIALHVPPIQPSISSTA